MRRPAQLLCVGVRERGKAIDVVLPFLRLGLTSFGGPVAHLGYFREEFVRRRAWLDEETFAHIVALCQFLPGPASSQVGIIIGLLRGGPLGALFAWLCFTLPSAVLLVSFALGVARFPGASAAPWMHGLLLAAVGVVAAAVVSMFVRLCPDWPRRAVAVLAAAFIVAFPANVLVQVLVMVVGAAFGRAVLFAQARVRAEPLPFAGSKRIAVVAFVAFAALLAGLPLAARFVQGMALSVFAAFYETGALVFGGGHVVLPLLQARVVPPGWIGNGDFMAGYGAAQAVPGPLFTFAAYLGAAMHGPVHGIGGAALALCAIYLPSFLLIAAILPFWNGVARSRAVVAALDGAGAAVVGLLFAALYRPVWTSAVHAPLDVAVAAAAFIALTFGKVPAYAVVVGCAFIAAALKLT